MRFESGRLAPEHEALLRQLLLTRLGAHLERYEIVGRREDYCVLYAAFGREHTPAMIKLAGPAAPFVHSFGRVDRIHRLIREQSAVPVAEILAFDDGYAVWPWRYLIQRHVAGRQWAAVRPTLDTAQRRDAYAQIGRAVAALHALPFSAWGPIAADGADHGTAEPSAALAERARTLLDDPARLALFLDVLAERGHLFTDVPSPALCHDDLHHYNILFQETHDRWQLATILDFDKSWAGMPESDLARMELWGMAGDGFWEGYLSAHTPAAGYQARRPLFQLLWCLEYGTASPEHTADTARVCAELGIAPMRFG